MQKKINKNNNGVTVFIKYFTMQKYIQILELIFLVFHKIFFGTIIKVYFIDENINLYNL